MPEATMGEYDDAPAWKHYVWPAGKVSSAQAEAKSRAVKERPDQQLWLGVTTAYPGHHPGSGFLTDLFGQSGPPRSQVVSVDQEAHQPLLIRSL